MVNDDLPNRPKPDPAKTTKKIAATDRVKSAANKLDPRFEAQRRKAEREEMLRAKAAKAKEEAAKAAAAAAGEPAEPTDEPEAEAKPKPTFSFNQFSSKRDAS